MNTDQSSTQVIEAPGAVQATNIKLIDRAKLIALAWGIILIVSLPQIVYRFFVPAVSGEPDNPLWLGAAQIVFLTVFWVATWVWPAVKPLQGFILALLAFCVGYFLIVPSIVYSTAWSNWRQEASWGVGLVADRLVTYLVPVVLMAMTLIGSGIGRRELFLIRGNLSAPCQPTRLLFMKESQPWNRFVRGFLLVYLSISVIVLGLQVRPDMSQIAQALIFLPAILIAAAITAFAEEFEFRSVPLSRLFPVLGKQQSIMITAALWGLMHYFGYPGGLIGVLMVWYLGFIFAKSMIETRGFVWAFFIHTLADIIIYAFLAMSV